MTINIFVCLLFKRIIILDIFYQPQKSNNSNTLITLHIEYTRREIFKYLIRNVYVCQLNFLIHKAREFRIHILYTILLIWHLEPIWKLFWLKLELDPKTIFENIFEPKPEPKS